MMTACQFVIFASFRLFFYLFKTPFPIQIHAPSMVDIWIVRRLI
ncbi:hypothetical protein ECTPHS_03322 [Ectothiorhodospira sp. PHS-1]|nr:hypothetical protein ECTPHS_03322 [Ectothiorhodospira sp. PHS-1]